MIQVSLYYPFLHSPSTTDKRFSFPLFSSIRNETLYYYKSYSLPSSTGDYMLLRRFYLRVKDLKDRRR